MIRRVCAAKLGEFASVVEPQHAIQELIPIFRQFSQDDQDACRVLCIESLIPLVRILSQENNRIHTLGSVLNASEDKSWKVRLCLAKNFAQFSKAFGREITEGNLVQTWNVLLNDNEPEVKNAAISSLCKTLKANDMALEKIMNFFLPNIRDQIADSQVAFKISASTALCAMGATVGRQVCSNQIIPIILELLKDDNHEVRLSTTQNMIKLAQVMGEQEFISPTMKTTLTQLTKD